MGEADIRNMRRSNEHQRDRVREQVRLYRKLAVAYLGGKCVRCPEVSALEIHHVDGNYKNNERVNLELLCHEHHKQANRENGSSIRPRTRKMTTRLSHSQTTVPKDIQEELGLKEGDRVVWGRNKAGQIVIERGVVVSSSDEEKQIGKD